MTRKRGPSHGGEVLRGNGCLGSALGVDDEAGTSRATSLLGVAAVSNRASGVRAYVKGY